MKQFLFHAPSAIALSSFAFVDRFRKTNAQSVQCQLDFLDGDFKYVCAPIVVTTDPPISNEYLPECEGTCTTNDDCQGGMQCWTLQREGDVPGCPGYPASSTGICYDAPVLEVVSCTGGGADDNEQNNLSLGNCQGHCEADLDCAIGLSCYRPGDLMEVPGCAGISENGVAYCFNSSSYTTLETFQPAAGPSLFAPSSFSTEIHSLYPSASPSSVPSERARLPPIRAPSNSSLPNGSKDTPPSLDTDDTPDIASLAPTFWPSATPNEYPSSGPSTSPTPFPTVVPSSSPSAVPSIEPTTSPSSNPSLQPSSKPSSSPSATTPSNIPSIPPSAIPSMAPTATPTENGVWNPNELPASPHSPSSMAHSDYPSDYPTESGAWNQNEIPVDPQSYPSNSPSFYSATSSTSAMCAINAGCADYGLDGYCCPTTDGVFLECCLKTPETSTPREISDSPSDIPSTSPTKNQLGVQMTDSPAISQSDRPSETPSTVPSSSRDASSGFSPFISNNPTEFGAWNPDELPAVDPNDITLPSDRPSTFPTEFGARGPDELTSDLPSSQPSDAPSAVPTTSPSSSKPSSYPTEFGARGPDELISDVPSSQPSDVPISSTYWINAT
jgi:hypothetical protein